MSFSAVVPAHISVFEIRFAAGNKVLGYLNVCEFVLELCFCSEPAAPVTILEWYLLAIDLNWLCLLVRNSSWEPPEWEDEELLLKVKDFESTFFI